MSIWDLLIQLSDDLPTVDGCEITTNFGWWTPYKSWDKPSINWCRISSIYSITHNYVQICQRLDLNRIDFQ